MRTILQDGQHLLRVAALFAAGTVLFFIFRGVMVPAGFGRYGHYRAGALADNRGRPITFAGRAACLDCHSDVPDAMKGSHHEHLSCESCHGALGAHAADPEKVNAVLPDPQTLCVSCHRAEAGRPAKFPQIDPKTHHEAGACKSCHKPHHPEPEAAS